MRPMLAWRRRSRAVDAAHARARAVALAARGVEGRATVRALRERAPALGHLPPELELTLALERPGAPPLEVVHRERLTPWQRHGLAPGAPVRVLHDRNDPRVLAVLGHARLRTEVRGGRLVAVDDVGGAGPPRP